MLNLLLSLVGIFALFCIVARLLHRYFVYVPDPRRVAPKEAGLTNVEEVVFKDPSDAQRPGMWFINYGNNVLWGEVGYAA